MTDKTRIRIAATLTVLFLAGISAVGLTARSDTPARAPTAAPAAVQRQPALAPAAQPTSHDDESYKHGDRQEHQVDD